MQINTPLTPSSPVIHGLTIRNPIKNLLVRGMNRLQGWFVKKPLLAISTSPKKILVSNIANLGDVLIATSVLPALKQQFPDAEIGFLSGSWSKNILSKHPLVHAIHHFDHYYVGKSFMPKMTALINHLRSSMRARSEIKNRGYDLAIDLQPYFPNSIPFLHKCKIPNLIGYTTGGFQSLLNYKYVWNNFDRYLGEIHLDLLRQSGINNFSSPGLPYYPNPKCRIPSKLGDKYIVLHMNASKKQKEWNQGAWEKLIRLLKGFQFQIVLTGKGIREKQICSSVAEITGVTDLSDELNWDQYSYVIQNALLVISVDSSSVHLAAANRTPLIIIFSGVNSPSIWAPRYDRCETLMKRVPCAPCFKKNGCSKMSCIQEVTAEEVFRKAEHFLSGF